MNIEKFFIFTYRTNLFTVTFHTKLSFGKLGMGSPTHLVADRLHPGPVNPLAGLEVDQH